MADQSAILLGIASAFRQEGNKRKSQIFSSLDFAHFIQEVKSSPS